MGPGVSLNGWDPESPLMDSPGVSAGVWGLGYPLVGRSRSVH